MDFLISNSVTFGRKVPLKEGEGRLGGRRSGWRRSLWGGGGGGGGGPGGWSMWGVVRVGVVGVRVGPGGGQNFALFFYSPDPLFFQFPKIVVELRWFLAISSLKMFSQHTNLEFSGHLVKPRPPASSGWGFTRCPDSLGVRGWGSKKKKP